MGGGAVGFWNLIWLLDEAKYVLLSYVMIAACWDCMFRPVGCAMRTTGSRSANGKFGEYCFKWCAWRTRRFTHATLLVLFLLLSLL
jgi:hypothetical protein